MYMNYCTLHNLSDCFPQITARADCRILVYLNVDVTKSSISEMMRVEYLVMLEFW